VQEIGAAVEGDVEQTDVVTQVGGAEVGISDEDRIVKHEWAFALYLPARKIPPKDAIFNQQAGVEIGLLEASRPDATIDQFDPLIKGASGEVERIQVTLLDDNRLVNAAHILPA